MKYIALLKDSLTEALDRKSLYVMLVISVLFILMFASISYSPMDLPDVMQDMASSFRKLAIVKGTSVAARTYDVEFKVQELRELGPEAGDFAQGYEFKLAVTPVKEFHRLVRHWDASQRGLLKKVDDPVSNIDEPADEDLEIRYLRHRYVEAMVPRRDVKRLSASDADRVYHVKLKPSRKETLGGAYRIHVLFGIYSAKLPVSVALTVFLMEHFLSEYMAGWGGVMVGIVFTAGSVPNMLQKGSIDVLLSKPVSRSALILYKYFGGLTYAAITGAVFIGGSWLVISARSGVWNWGYLATLGTLMLFFAVLYSIGVLIAVLTRSTVAAILIPIVAWVLGSIVNFIKLRAELGTFDLPEWVPKLLEALSWVLPRAGDINVMNNHFMMQGSFGNEVEEMARAMQADMPEVAWMRILLSSGLFITVMVSAACVLFARRDH